MKKLFNLMFLLLAMSPALFGQVRNLTGTVTSSEDGAPIPGATVVLKGTSTGVITDADGTYTIPVSASTGVLSFSFIGMQTVELEITNANTYDVVLVTTAIGLDDVVVTALGITREKKTLGFAVQDLDGSELTKANDPNIVNSLSGKIAGVQVTSGGSTVGASSRIVIRGNSSFAGNQPLFVIDGTPVDNRTTDLGGGGGIDWGNTASDIDPNNIETMTVLKGANAAALYGSRATNGVIIITTKKGNKGGRRLGVDINSSFMWDKAAYFPALQNEYGGGWAGSEYLWNQYNQENGTSMSYNDYADQFSYRYVDGEGGGVNDSWPINWGPRMDAGLLLDQWSTGPNSPWVSRPENVEEWFNTGSTMNNSIAFTANGDKASGRVAYSNLNTTGIIDYTDQKQNTINTSVTLTPTSKLTATANLTYLRKESENMPNNGYAWADIFGWLQRDYPTQYAKDLFYEKGNEDYIFNADNPFYTLRNLSSFFRDRVYGNISAKYEITDWLSVSGRAGLDFYNEYRKNITQSGTVRNTQRGLGGQFDETQFYHKEVNADAALNFDKTWGDFRVDGLLGANFRNDLYKSMYMRASDLTVPDLYTISNVNGNPTVRNYTSEYETNSVYFAANGSYKNYLYLGITGRNDWSSSLPAENRSYFYPSVSLGWSITDAFKTDSKSITYAKLRASWAQVGGDTAPYQLDRTYSASSYNSISMFSPTSTMPPTNLLPEETTSFEVGADMRFWNDRLALDITYYNQVTVNQILAVATSSTTGYRSMRLNAGEIANNGVEIMLNASLIQNPGGFSWDLTFNWAKNKSMVNTLYGDLESYVISGGFGGCKTLGIPGQEWGVLWGLPFVKDEAGKTVVDERGIPKTTSEGENLGTVTPDWTGGMNNSFRYKNAYLSFLIDARIGGDIFSTTAWHSYPTGSYEVTVKDNVRENGMIVDAVFEDGSPNDVRVAAQDYFGGSWMWNNHEYSILDGSYIKLRELVLGYDFNVSNVSWLYRLNLSFFARNLAILYQDQTTKDLGIDPEVGLGGTESGVGYENFQIPTTRSFGFKLNISF